MFPLYSTQPGLASSVTGIPGEGGDDVGVKTQGAWLLIGVTLERGRGAPYQPHLLRVGNGLHFQ